MFAVAVLGVAGLAGCATTGATKGAAAEPAVTKPRNPDPWEGLNRPLFKFNDAIDRNALRPVAVVYRNHTPDWFRTGVSNFFTNLFYPTTIANQFLQGKIKEGGQDIARFLINSTLGWGGVLDVASGARLPVNDEDFGQTLGWWGVPPGPFVMLPLLGPATLRDTPSRIADDFTQPFRWYNADNERWFSLALYLVDKRSDLLPLDRAIREAYDPYVFVRDAYLQRREYAVRDGNVAEQQVEDESNWAEEALREDEAAAAEEAGSGSEAPAGNANVATPAEAPAQRATPPAAPPPPEGTPRAEQ